MDEDDVAAVDEEGRTTFDGTEGFLSSLTGGGGGVSTMGEREGERMPIERGAGAGAGAETASVPRDDRREAGELSNEEEREEREEDLRRVEDGVSREGTISSRGAEETSAFEGVLPLGVVLGVPRAWRGFFGVFFGVALGVFASFSSLVSCDFGVLLGVFTSFSPFALGVFFGVFASVSSFVSSAFGVF